MKKLLYILMALMVLSLAMTETGNATPVLWTVNGHYYEIITYQDGISWDDAKIAAESMSYNGLQGHLATITSAEENYFISYDPGLGNGTNDSGIEDKWLGGYQVEGSQEPDQGWQWITGEAFGYNNWAPGEPSNSPDGENAIIFQHGWVDDIGKQWNDLISSWTQSGFIVEYEASSVPEPVTFLLLGLGLVGIASLKRKIK